MSRIGKKPIEILPGVTVVVNKNQASVKGPKGELVKEFRPELKIEVKEGKIIVTPVIETENTKAFWGLTRALLQNMVTGVAKGYEKKLEIQGIGYKAAIEGDILILNVGFSHQVKMKIPSGIKAKVDKNIITVSGIDKDLVGLTSAKIRKVKPPEPYKGKGIRYLGENVRRKAGKKVVTGGAPA